MFFSILISSTLPDMSRFLFAFAFCRLAQRFDSYIQQLGLNAATTGGSLFDEIYGTAKSVSGLVKAGRRGGSGGGGGKDAILSAETGNNGRGLLSNLWSGGAVGVAGNAIRGAAKGYTAARQNGKPLTVSSNEKDNGKSGAIKDAVRQAGINIRSSAIPETRRPGGSNAADAAIQKAAADASKGDYSTYQKLPDSMKRYAQSLYEQDPSLGISPEVAAAAQSAALHANMTGAQKEADNSEEALYRAVKKDVEADTWEKWDGDEDAVRTRMGECCDSIRRFSNSDRAIDISTQDSANEAFGGQVWSSSLLSCGVNNETFDRHSNELTGFWETLEAESRGVPPMDTSRVGNIESETRNTWVPNEEVPGGKYTKGTFRRTDNSGFAFTIHDEKSIAGMRRKYGNNRYGKDMVREFSDKAGNKRYMVIDRTFRPGSNDQRKPAGKKTT